MSDDNERLRAELDLARANSQGFERMWRQAIADRDELRQALHDLLATRKGIDYTTAEEQDVLRRARRLAR